MRFTNRELRTTRGQLTLMAAAYAGALALAVAAVALRGAVFERFARDLAPVPTDELAAGLAKALAAGPAPAAELIALADREQLARLEEDAAKRWWVPGVKDAAARYRKLTAARAGGEMRSADAAELRRQELDVLYGAYLARPDLDAGGHLSRSLQSLDPATTLSLVRRTLVVGTRGQKLRALALLGAAPGESRAEAARLADYAAEQARRRGDRELADAAGAARERPAE